MGGLAVVGLVGTRRAGSHHPLARVGSKSLSLEHEMSENFRDYECYKKRAARQTSQHDRQTIPSDR